MMDPSKHTNNTPDHDKPESIHGYFLEKNSGDEREEMKEVWQKSGLAEREKPEMPAGQVERALEGVHRRLGLSDSHPAGEKKYGSDINARWLLAAAVILLVFGAGLFFIPKSYTVSYGEIAAVELPDGSVVELNSGSQLWHRRMFFNSERTVHLDGEAFFNVRGGESPFVVNANEARVEVRGTQFNVRSWSSDPESPTQITVSEGEVRFYPLEAPERYVNLTSGEMSLWNRRMAEPAAPETVPLERFLGWRDNMIVFNEKPLMVIFGELERKYNVSIDLEEPGVALETLTTYYSDPQSVESVLNDICMVKGLRFSRTTTGYRVYK